jgi:hypothetical protein
MRSAAKPDLSEAFCATCGQWRLAPRRNARLTLDAVSGWKLGLLITDFARFIISEIALRCGRQGAAAHGELLVGSGGTHEENARSREGGLVGHALGAKRVAFGPRSRQLMSGTRGAA